MGLSATWLSSGRPSLWLAIHTNQWRDQQIHVPLHMWSCTWLTSMAIWMALPCMAQYVERQPRPHTLLHQRLLLCTFTLKPLQTHHQMSLLLQILLTQMGHQTDPWFHSGWIWHHSSMVGGSWVLITLSALYCGSNHADRQKEKH